MDIEQLLTSLRDVIDAREKLAEQDRELSRQKAEIEAKLFDFHAQTKLLSVASDGLSVTFDPAAMRARYDPEKWNDIARWAAETGNTHIIQRRLTDAKVLELFDAGVAFPEGLSLERYTKISFRRK